MGKIFVVGIGPGKDDMMTFQASKALEQSDVIVGYTVYVSLLSEKFADKEILATPMKKEVDRCKLCLQKAEEGKTVSLICSGDSGVYGMASLIIELSREYDAVDIEIIPGITAALSGGALLGAPLGHDFCVISLSDLLTPWELIAKRLRCAAEGDFAISIYNPASKKRADYLDKACDILLEYMEPERICGYAVNIGRENEYRKILTLKELKDENLDMFTTVFIGNSKSKVINNMLVTPRGYLINEK